LKERIGKFLKPSQKGPSGKLTEPSEDGIELYEEIKEYMKFYNTRRLHQSLDYNIPENVYVLAAQIKLNFENSRLTMGSI